MYVGRIVAVGRSKAGRLAAMYRVSSRSFPNRRAKVNDGAISIIPKEGYESDIYRNPYIAYNCLKLVDGYAVATNGSQTDPIAEKLEDGMTVRDALSTVMLALDYERDSYNTPRIAAVVKSGNGSGWLGIVRKDALLVREFQLDPGSAFYVCTYERNAPSTHHGDNAFDVDSAAAACDYVLGQGAFAELERPVTAACALETETGGFDVAVKDAAVNGA